MRRQKKGQSLIEFVLATTVVIPIVMLSIDSFLILYGMQLNQAICRDAARAAAGGDPRLVLARASQIVSQASANGQGTFSLSLVAAGTTITRSQLEAVRPYGGQISGVVDVTTAVEVKPILLGWFLGGQKCLHITATEKVPSTYSLPNVLEKLSSARDCSIRFLSNYT